jgi:hypothetical protein
MPALVSLVSPSLRSVAWTRVEIRGKGRGRESEVGGGAGVDDVNLVKESRELVNPIHEVFFIISVFFISNFPGLS